MLASLLETDETAERGLLSAGPALGRLPRPFALVLAASCLLAAPSAADNTADEADLRFNRGVSFYRAQRYEDALAEFFHSNRLVRNRNVIHNIARCYERLRRHEEAYRYYREALEEYEPDEDTTDLERSLTRLEPRVALLRVETEPIGADIFIERRDLGSRGLTPRTLALPAGKTTVMLSMAGYRDMTLETTLETGSTVSLEVPLEFIFGRVRVEGPPDGAEARLDRPDGELVGVLPEALKLAPGRHILHVGAPGYVAAQIPVEATADEEISVSLELSPLPPPTGILVVTANRDGALVRVGGRDMGFTPVVLELPAGPQRVEVSMPDMRTHDEEVMLEDGGRMVVEADLRFVGAKTTAASKIEIPLEEAPASITVISREEIQAFGYTSLPETLRAVRGLFLSNDRTYEYLGVRGFSPPGDLNSRILILYDGHTMNDIYAGHAYLGRENSFDLEDVERIEIVRGPVSSLFGTGAFLGVINIVPREQDPGRSANLSASAGSLGLARARGTLSHRGQDMDVQLSLGAMTTQGEEVFWLPAQGSLPEVAVRDRDGERVLGGDARLRYREVELFGRFNSRSKDVPTGAYYTLLDQPSMEMHDNRAFIEGRWRPALEGGASFVARAFYDATRYSGRFLDEDGEQIDYGEADWVGAELRYRSPEWMRQNITIGLEYQGQLRVYQSVFYEGEQELDDTHIFHIASAYITDELRLSDRFLVNASARMDQYFLEDLALAINPRLAIIARTLPDGVTKAMWGRSFRAPSVYERYYEDGPLDPQTGERDYRSARADELLGPEIIHTLELEHSQQLGDEVRLTGAVFANFITDLVVHTMEPGEEYTYRMNAAGLVRTEGAELELRWQPGRMSMLSAAYWYQRMTIVGLDDPEEESRLRANAPAHAFSLRGMFPVSAPMMMGAVEAVYNGPRLTYEGMPTGEIFLLNAGLSGEIDDRGFQYFAGVHNLLDERAQLPVGDEVPRTTLPSIGRTFLLQARLSY